MLLIVGPLHSFICASIEEFKLFIHLHEHGVQHPYLLHPSSFGFGGVRREEEEWKVTGGKGEVFYFWGKLSASNSPQVTSVHPNPSPPTFQLPLRHFLSSRTSTFCFLPAQSNHANGKKITESRRF